MGSELQFQSTGHSYNFPCIVSIWTVSSSKMISWTSPFVSWLEVRACIGAGKQDGVASNHRASLRILIMPATWSACNLWYSRCPHRWRRFHVLRLRWLSFCTITPRWLVAAEKWAIPRVLCNDNVWCDVMHTIYYEKISAWGDHFC